MYISPDSTGFVLFTPHFHQIKMEPLPLSDDELAIRMLQQDELMMLILTISSQILQDEASGRKPDQVETVPIVKKTTRKHRYWVHSLWQKRSELGAYNNLVWELSLDDEKFKEFFRLNKIQFAEILTSVEADLVKFCHSREVICPRQRLAVAIR